ncbi:MAG: hypothetical protein AAGA09_07960 [Pseudomonadota bacterium]
MPTSTGSQVAASIIIFLGVAFVWAVDPPFVVTAIFMAACVGYSAWIFVSVFRGADELESAGVRYGLAAASGFGAPFSLAFVMLVIAAPNVQNAIANIAAVSKTGLPPAAGGFALGITFTVIVLCVVLIIANSLWWASRR